MRLLLYGLQASGASATAMLAAQRPGCLAVVDVPSYACTPAFGQGHDAMAKAVVSLTHPFDHHVAAFRPDAVVLVTRDPLRHYASASAKDYRDRDGALDAKMAAFDALYAGRAQHADAVVRHEDLMARDPAVLETFARLGWELPDDAFDLPRGVDAILNALFTHARALFDGFDHSFGEARPDGGIGPAGVRERPLPTTERARVLELTPHLAGAYGYGAQRQIGLPDPGRP